MGLSSVQLQQQSVEFLRSNQNADGGWGYFPGKQSWLEPTAWAALALHGEPAAEKAAKLIASWQSPDGSCRPCAAVTIPNWTAALAVIVSAKRGDKTAAKRGVDYLLGSTGTDSGMIARITKFLSPGHTDREPRFQGWPWMPGNSSWIEPTAHSITALRLAGRLLGANAAITERIESAQNMILNQRCTDGGWNYGAREALGHQLVSFPETTALALVGLAGRQTDAVAYAEKLLTGPAHKSPLADAWLRIALRMHGRDVAANGRIATQPDVMITAIEALDWKVLA